MVTDAMKALVTKWELKTIAIIHPLSKKNKHVIRWGKCKKNLNQLRINNVFTSSHILQLLLKKLDVRPESEGQAACEGTEVEVSGAASPAVINWMWEVLTSHAA